MAQHEWVRRIQTTDCTPSEHLSAHTSDLSTQHRSIERVKRNVANPSDVLRLLKQPVGMTRVAVRAADYMDNAVKLIKKSLERRQKRSINATGVYPKQVL